MKFKNIFKGFFALSPVVVLLIVYLFGSMIAGDFYKIPITAAFLLASVYAISVTRGHTLSDRINLFSAGAASSQVMLMVWIFILAGSFAAIAKAMGSVDATVAVTLQLIPENYLPVGIFIASCFISMAIGTSVGTIVALTPVVTALAGQIGCDIAWIVAIVVGGSFFGDNLSFISDTTIAATQTQGCSMRDKFRTNFLLVFPAAIVSLLIYLFSGKELTITGNTPVTMVECVKVIPYIIVVVTALAGINVLLVLLIGILASVIIGLATDALGVIDIFTYAGSGITSMGDLIIVTMLAGGLLELVRINGGMNFLIRILTFGVRSKRAAEFSIAMLTIFSNICTANNTVAILSSGTMARNIAGKFGIAARRSASIMDTSSCFVQGLLPYGAQLLMASGLAAVSPLEIIPNLYYPLFIGIMVVFSILFDYPRCREKC